jgi:cell division protein FtsW
MSEPRYSKQNYNNVNPTGYILSAPDKGLMIITGFLALFGIMMILSAGASKCVILGMNPGAFAIRQFICFVLGFAVMMWLSRFNYLKLEKYSGKIAWIVIFLLILIDFTPLGVTVNGAKRWLAFGPLQFQPSEIGKLAVSILLASAFKNDLEIFEQEKWQKYFVPIAIIAFLTFIQPNLSMVIIFALICLVCYLVSGGPWQIFAGGAGVAALGIALFIKPYQLSRIQVWLHPESDPYGAGYNIIQSLLAFVSGGFFGVGFGGSRQKLEWLPEAHTDFIFAVIAEEWGWIGCVAVIGLFFWFVCRGLVIAANCKDMFGKILATGITVSIGSQAFINMSVASSFVPATGVPMPFISYGGTSLIITMAMVGVLLNISKVRIPR